MGNNKKIRIQTRNNKMVMNNLTRVSKRHVRNTKGTRLDMKIVFLGHRGTKRLKIEGPRHNIGGHQGHQEMHRGHYKH